MWLTKDAFCQLHPYSELSWRDEPNDYKKENQLPAARKIERFSMRPTCGHIFRIICLLPNLKTLSDQFYKLEPYKRYL